MLSFVAFIGEDNDSYLAFEKAEVLSHKAIQSMNYDRGFAPLKNSNTVKHAPTRLARVTIPALIDAGAQTFAWMTKSEKSEFDLHAPYGAFLYCSEDTRVYVALKPYRSAHQHHEEEDEEIGSFRSAHPQHEKGVEAPQTYMPFDGERE